VELSQSRKEQQEYLKNVELARVLDKRAEKKRKAGEDVDMPAAEPVKKQKAGPLATQHQSKKKVEKSDKKSGEDRQLSSVLGSIF
jgi:ESF2/ABP1 family protein